MKLVIYLTTPTRVEMCEAGNPIEVPDLGGWRQGLPEYGDDWARWWKTDIVMLVETCKHCEETVYRDPEGVLHVWKHLPSDAYQCWPPREPQTQAEPQEIL
jgi:hypothetical protein